MMKENFPLGIKILFKHITLLIGVLFKNFRYVRFMLSKVYWFVLAIVLPIVALVFVNLSVVTNIVKNFSELIGAAGIVGVIIEQVQSIFLIFLIFLAYLFIRIVGWFQLSEPSSLVEFAKERIKGTEYDIISMGHTHNPSAYLFNKTKRFYNTGTWIPIIESSTATVRKDRTFTFLHLVRNNFGKLRPSYEGLLQRWNDDVERPDAMIILKRK